MAVTERTKDVSIVALFPGKILSFLSCLNAQNERNETFLPWGKKKKKRFLIAR